MDRNALAELLQALESRRDAEERRREERYTALIERDPSGNGPKTGGIWAYGHTLALCPMQDEEEEPLLPRPMPEWEEPEGPQPKREEPERPQPKREEPERPQPKREEPERPQPKREEPERPQPKREEPERPQPKREEPERPQPKREEPERPRSVTTFRP
ncbi:UNVERIFIED_CONTAM: hypothetical protein FKN15_035907 [Acipenser sinensis]